MLLTQKAPSNKASTNPQAPKIATPVPSLGPKIVRPQPVPDTTPPPVKAPVSYIPQQAQNTTDFQCQESKSILVPGGNMPAKRAIIDLSLNASLPYRKLYAFLSLNPSGTNYNARLTIEFWRNGSLVGALPLCGGGGTNSGDVLPSICVAGGNVFSDCMAIVLNTGAAVVLQPFYTHQNIDKITVSIVSSVAVQDCFVWLGVASSLQR
jgi:hypothetical protein